MPVRERERERESLGCRIEGFGGGGCGGGGGLSQAKLFELPFRGFAAQGVSAQGAVAYKVGPPSYK